MFSALGPGTDLNQAFQWKFWHFGAPERFSLGLWGPGKAGGTAFGAFRLTFTTGSSVLPERLSPPVKILPLSVKPRLRNVCTERQKIVRYVYNFSHNCPICLTWAASKVPGDGANGCLWDVVKVSAIQQLRLLFAKVRRPSPSVSGNPQ